VKEEESDDGRLEGEGGVVTGGGSGTGKATAPAMARAGAALVIGNRDAARGEEVVGLIRQAGGRAVFQKTDVSRPADVGGLVERAVKEFGRLLSWPPPAGKRGTRTLPHLF
jgi:NAD(P)-dependent dehydrogenase (short-subunit alcohol dehydrogenase family)